jgi:hypothetical protein
LGGQERQAEYRCSFTDIEPQDVRCEDLVATLMITGLSLNEVKMYAARSSAGQFLFLPVPISTNLIRLRQSFTSHMKRRSSRRNSNRV